MSIISFKTAYRSLVKRKGFSLLNMLGLAIGMTSCLLIFHYVSFERSFDNFSNQGDQVVRLRLDNYRQGTLSWKSATSYPAIGPTMKKEFPEVEDFCRLYDYAIILSNPGNNVKYSETKGYYADASAIPMLGVDIIAGTSVNALSEVKQMVISESMAKKYFGHEDPMGKRLLIGDEDLGADNALMITGVFKDFPVNSHLQLNYLVSYKTFQYRLNAQGDTTNASETEWGWYDFYTYLQLKKGTDLKKFEAKFPAFCNTHMNNGDYSKKNNIIDALSLIPLKDIHLYSNYNQEAEVNGNGQAVSFLFLIALFILGIAWVNYINLSTARSVERAKEVGVRKVMGAQRSSLIQQFLTESLLLNLLSFIISLIVFSLILHPFDVFTGKSYLHYTLMSAQYWILFSMMFIVGTLLSGMYPAIVLSGFQPVTVLKGMFKNSSSGVLLRKSLIITQFVTSVVLIAGTIIVFNQLKYMRSHDLGANIDRTVVLSGVQTVTDSMYNDLFSPFKSAVLSGAQVASVSASTSVMGKEIYWTNGVQRVDVPEASAHTMYNMGVDYDFIPSYQIKMIAGRNYAKEFSTDNRGVILTENGARELGFTDMNDAINKKLKRGRDTLTILGIAASYHHQGLQKSLDPMIILLRPNARNYYSVKLKSGNTAQALAQIESEWNKFFPKDPFNYFFLDEAYNEQYKGEILFGKVFAIFAILGILIACFGLLGLSAYNVIQRTKEIGIRKVIGASEVNILKLLTKDFILLVLIALVIAIPLCYWIMKNWLAGFAFRTTLDWKVFLISGGIALLIAFITISVQAFKAITSKPVTSLRME
ncbi:MAG: ABC transporter permease [Saprospiraceae bacterium]|nr:ABC transporter permease [Saprospiraceae bacterium]